MTDNTITPGVAGEVLRERHAQDGKWGEQDHDILYWLGVLVEEVGEVAKAAIEGREERYRAELIHVAAVAQGAAECFDRRALALAARAGKPAPGTRVRDDTGTASFDGTVHHLACADPDRVWVIWDAPRRFLGGGGGSLATTALVRDLEVLDARA